MQTSKAILISSAVVSASVLVHLGYTITKDYASSRAIRQEQERLAKASSDMEHKALSKQLWRQAVGLNKDESESEHAMHERMKIGTDLVWKLEDWIKRTVKLDKHHYIAPPDTVYAKAFALPDVEWHDARRVTVSGYLMVDFSNTLERKEGKPMSIFNWTRDMELDSDGVDSWWQAKDPMFTDAGLSTEEMNHKPVAVLMERSSELLAEKLRP